jgi:hypothetical protein
MIKMFLHLLEIQTSALIKRMKRKQRSRLIYSTHFHKNNKTRIKKLIYLRTWKRVINRWILISRARFKQLLFNRKVEIFLRISNKCSKNLHKNSRKMILFLVLVSVKMSFSKRCRQSKKLILKILMTLRYSKQNLHNNKKWLKVKKKIYLG